MKIDLNSPVPGPVTGDRSTKQVLASGTNDVPEATQDRTTFHSDSVSVQALTSQAMQSAAIRQSKVDALRQAVNNGTHSIDPVKIAEGFLANHGE